LRQFKRNRSRHKSSAYNRTLKQRRIFKLDYLLALLELELILDYRIEQLSVGERQRVALVRSLLKSPQILLLDETFAAIGNSYRVQLLPILKRLQTELDLPVLYASQSLGEILQLTDQLAVLEQGKVLRNSSYLSSLMAKFESTGVFELIHQQNLSLIGFIEHGEDFSAWRVR